MGQTVRSRLPAAVEAARARIAAWRKQRGHRRVPMPEPLWETAARWAGTHGIAAVARALGLDFYGLKRRVVNVKTRTTAGAWGQSLNSEWLLPKQARELGSRMARPLRIQFPGALYHVTFRGNEHCPVVRDDDDRAKRMNWLRRTVEAYGWRLHRAASVTPCLASRRPRRDCGRLRPGCEYSLFKL